MNRLVRIGIVAAVAICVGTAALAVAESNRYPNAKQIPTVVSGPIVAAGPVVTVGAGDALEPAEGASPTPVKPGPDQAPAAVERPSGGSAVVRDDPSDAGTPATASSAEESDDDDDDREVVTRAVRDEDDQHSSSDKERDGEKSREQSHDAQDEDSE